MRYNEPIMNRIQKTMKRIKKAYAAVLLSVALLLPCCSRDMAELPEEGVPGTETGATDDTEQGYSLRLKVSDAGYRDGLTASRATDDGLTTTFEEGDVLGVYVVNGEGEILYSNVPYTLIGDEWLAPHNVRLKDFPLTVYAYYPYVKDEAMEGKVTAPATEAAADYTATDFFQPYLTELDITDQSTPELYRQADVMACKTDIADEEAAAGPLTLTMDHQMGLVMINLPGEMVTNEIRYKISGKEDYVWSESYPSNLSGERLYMKALPNGNGYRYLYKPGNIAFSGEFYTNDVKKSYSVSDVTIDAGKCKTYNISLSTISEQPIEVGDFFLSDGTLRSKDTFLTDDEKQKCVGIVYYTGTFSNAVNGKTHALVTGLKEKQSQWSTSTSTISTVGKEGDGFVGYNGTQTLLMYNNFTYPIVNMAYNDLSSEILLLGKTSGWYIPSADELKELYKSKTTVNISLKALDELAIQLSSSNYWSTGEHLPSTAWYVTFNYGSVHYNTKISNYSVRLSFAF